MGYGGRDLPGATKELPPPRRIHPRSERHRLVPTAFPALRAGRAPAPAPRTGPGQQWEGGGAPGSPAPPSPHPSPQPRGSARPERAGGCGDRAAPAAGGTGDTSQPAGTCGSARRAGSARNLAGRRGGPRSPQLHPAQLPSLLFLPPSSPSLPPGRSGGRPPAPLSPRGRRGGGRGSIAAPSPLALLHALLQAPGRAAPNKERRRRRRG